MAAIQLDRSGDLLVAYASQRVIDRGSVAVGDAHCFVICQTAILVEGGESNGTLRSRMKPSATLE